MNFNIISQKNLKFKLKKGKELYDKIDEKLLQLFNAYANGELTPSGETVKIKKEKKC
jgi:hypothetical protein